MKGYKLVRSVMAEHRLGEEDFFKSKRQEHLSARIDAIKRLKAAGLNHCEIALVMRRDRSTVRYWLKPDMRARKIYRVATSRRRSTSPEAPLAVPPFVQQGISP
ncbi:hypothetical protein JQ628_11430 [Bradyrhizobium lablabi]|uniref:hypothetical protein n=1 Tax=Bradyrhizobium lablabi TaxID=722472 RepID=UPI001BA9F959|nr:hypothetical protein [Bradyrhizobium lablabi]MBR1122127.1 hypothetical protein [Bradyrhizobium lablabi]